MSRHRGRYPQEQPPQPQFVGHESLEEDNSLREDELKEKVKALKSLTIEIGDEARYHTKLAREVDDQFDSAAGLLKNSIGKVLRLAKSGNRFHLFYLFLFCLFVFLVIWWIK